MQQTARSFFTVKWDYQCQHDVTLHSEKHYFWGHIIFCDLCKLVLERTGFLDPIWPIGQEPISCFL